MLLPYNLQIAYLPVTSILFDNGDGIPLNPPSGLNVKIKLTEAHWTNVNIRIPQYTLGCYCYSLPWLKITY